MTAHRRAYCNAAQFWLFAGYLPPAHDFGDDPPDDDASPSIGQ